MPVVESILKKRSDLNLWRDGGPWKRGEGGNITNIKKRKS